MTICTDTPEEIRKQRKKHGARAVMLCDPELEVTARYELRNVSPTGISPLPIPTTFLVDAEGIVRWIDQAEDYRVRSHPDRLLQAIEAGLGQAPS